MFCDTALLAPVIEDEFTTSLRRRLEERPLTMIVVALVTGFISMMANAPTLFTTSRGGDLTAQEVTVSRDRVARDITSELSRLRSAQAGARIWRILGGENAR